MNLNILLIGGSGGVPKLWGRFKGSHIFSADGDWSNKKKLRFCLQNKATQVNKFFSSSFRKRKFYVYNDNFLSSFHKFSGKKNNRYAAKAFKILKVKKVEPITIDAFSKQQKITIHALDLDCQGHSLDVLKGASRSLKNILLVKCEIDFLELYKNTSTAGDVLGFMRKYGFRLLRTYACGDMKFPYSFDTAKPGMGREDGFIAWMDCVFLKDPQIVKKSSNQNKQYYKMICSIMAVPSIPKMYDI